MGEKKRCSAYVCLGGIKNNTVQDNRSSATIRKEHCQKQRGEKYIHKFITMCHCQTHNNTHSHLTLLHILTQYGGHILKDL